MLGLHGILRWIYFHMSSPRLPPVSTTYKFTSWNIYHTPSLPSRDGERFVCATPSEVNHSLCIVYKWGRASRNIPIHMCPPPSFPWTVRYALPKAWEVRNQCYVNCWSGVHCLAFSIIQQSLVRGILVGMLSYFSKDSLCKSECQSRISVAEHHGAWSHCCRGRTFP